MRTMFHRNNKLNENDEEATEVQVATIDAMNVYIVQVASIGGNQDLKSIEEKLKSFIDPTAREALTSGGGEM